MVGVESIWGTEVTVTRAYEFDDEGPLQFTPGWIESQGLKAGVVFTSVSRVVQSRFDVAGDLNMDFVDQGGMGLLLKHALGSAITTPTQIAATTAYSQIHTPGPRTGLGLTVQLGRPQTDGTVRPHTYYGCKFAGWEFSVSDNEMAKLRLTVNGRNENTATALAVASYNASAAPFSFSDASTFTVGGTASTTGGETTIAGGTAVTTVATGATITGEVPMASERYGLGNAGNKREQIENGIQTVTMALTSEYTSRAEFYDLLKSAGTTAIQLDFSHGDAGGGNAYLLSFVLPACKVKEGGPHVGGPDLVDQPITLQAYSDGTNPVIQIKLVSVDSTLSGA